MGDQFTIIYWNIWLKTQLHPGRPDSILLAEFDALTDRYRPDAFGLNEVLCPSGSTTNFVLEHLARRGYSHIHFASSGPIAPEWDIGNAIVSRHPLSSVEETGLGPVKTRRSTISPRVITARLGDQSLDVMVAHLAYLSRQTLPAHYLHQARLVELLAARPDDVDFILGGDFNEPTWMRRSFARQQQGRLAVATGDWRRPTWRMEARPAMPIRANLDKVFWSRSGSWQLSQSEVALSRASDHRPLFSCFRRST